MNIIQSLSPNFSDGRKKYDGQQENIFAIIDHITAGLMPGTLSWLKNPAAQASAHYLITKRGDLYQLVKDEDTAWHAGIINKPNWSLYDQLRYNPNRWTIGIEHECVEGGELTEAQYEATLWLHKQLISKWNIPIDRDHIVGHYRVDSVNRANDPGRAFPWDRLIADLRGDDELATIPKGATECKIEIGEKVFPGYVLTNTAYFRQGVSVRAVKEAMDRQISWDTAGFKVVIK